MSSFQSSVFRARSWPANFIRALPVALLVLAGCSMPTAMRVETFDHPQHVDTDVRFRTTYYFRVFDECKADDGSVSRTDHALYRFRMSGKANSLSTQTKFESGVLHKSQIDPFGATVRRDERTGSLVTLTQDFVRREYMDVRSVEDAKELIVLRDRVSKQATDATREEEKKALASLAERLAVLADEALRRAPEAVVLGLPAQVRDLAQAFKAYADKLSDDAQKKAISNVVESLNALVDKGVQAGAGQAASGACRHVRNGFQVMGPEGVTEYDQDSRLLMAMSTSAKPLISTLEELSGRLSGVAGNTTGFQMPVHEARRKASDAELDLLRTDSQDLEAVIKSLNKAAERFVPAPDTAGDVQ